MESTPRSDVKYVNARLTEWSVQFQLILLQDITCGAIANKVYYLWLEVLALIKYHTYNWVVR